MSKGGGQTQTQTTKTEIPKWLEDAGKSNLQRAEYVSQLGYVPYYGLDVAAFSPMQMQGMQATGMGAQAFGLAPQGFNATAGIPTPTTDSLGFTGYSSGQGFDQALANLYANRPGQYNAMQDMFINPQTGDIGTFFTPEGSVGTNPLATNQTSAANMGLLNQMVGTGPADYENALGIPQNAQDWNDLSPEMQKLTSWLIPGYGLINAVQSAKDAYDQAQAQKAAESLYNSNVYSIPASSGSSGSSGSYNWSSGGSLSAGRGTGAGTNPSSTISGGSGRTDGGWGW